MTTMTDPTIVQDSYRGRNDDGSQSTATWKANANTVFTQAVDTTFRLRFLIKQTDSAANQNLGKNYQLRFSKNGGAYTAVAAQGATSSAVRYADSSNITDNVATTQQIGAGTFVAGAVDENGDTGTITFNSAATSETEVEFVIQVYSGQATGSDTVAFRVYTTAGVALNTYTNTLTLTVPTTGSAAITESADTASAVGKEVFTGTAAISESVDSASASGTAGGFLGTAAATEDADVASASGLQTIAGTAPATENADTASGTGTQVLSGSASITESDDAIAGSAALGFTGTVSSSETEDSAVGAALLSIVGTASITAANDNASGEGSSRFIGSAEITESDDQATGAGTARLSILGSGAVTESSDESSGSAILFFPTPESRITHVSIESRLSDQSGESRVTTPPVRTASTVLGQSRVSSVAAQTRSTAVS